jgi:hypothetical protein
LRSACVLQATESYVVVSASLCVTSDRSNNFPQLPIRVGEHIFVWIAHFGSADAFAAYRARVAKDRQWQQRIWPSLRDSLGSPKFYA